MPEDQHSPIPFVAVSFVNLLRKRMMEDWLYAFNAL